MVTLCQFVGELDLVCASCYPYDIITSWFDADKIFLYLSLHAYNDVAQGCHQLKTSILFYRTYCGLIRTKIYYIFIPNCKQFHTANFWTSLFNKWQDWYMHSTLYESTIPDS